ncbi:MAG: SPFH domain-containing protein, partial [Planctomycetota bacterium]
GKIVSSGAGLSLWYFAPNSVIVQVSLATQDIPFVFEQQTADFQDVTIQGNLTFRVEDPVKLTAHLDYSTDPRGRYVSDDPDSLRDRLVRLLQVESHEYVRSQELEPLLRRGAELGAALTNSLGSSSLPVELGLAIESLDILSIKATPEMQAALQAETREATLQKADQAVHERRKLAIESDQEIRERELANERIIQEKQREVREAELAADVAIEQARTQLVEKQAENEKILAGARATALRESFGALQKVDWKTISAVSGSSDSKELIAMAFAQLAENANKIGRLDITPELLTKLTGDQE